MFGLVLNWIRGLFTPTGAVVVPMVVLLGVLLGPNIDKVMGGLGFETKTKLKEEIGLLTEEVGKLEREKEGLGLLVKALKGSISDYDDIIEGISKGDKEVDDVLKKYLRTKVEVNEEPLIEEPEVFESSAVVEVEEIKEVIVEKVRVSYGGGSRVESSSRENILAIHGTYEAFFGS